MKNRKPTNESRGIIERRREARLRRTAPLEVSSGKALENEEDDSFEEAFEFDAEDLALADTERSPRAPAFDGE